MMDLPTLNLSLQQAMLSNNIPTPVKEALRQINVNLTELETETNLTGQDSAAATHVISPTANNLPSEGGVDSSICGIVKYGSTVDIANLDPNTLVVFKEHERGRIIVVKVRHEDNSISPEDVLVALLEAFGIEVKIFYQGCKEDGQEGECLRWRLVSLALILSFLLFSDCLKLV